MHRCPKCGLILEFVQEEGDYVPEIYYCESCAEYLTWNAEGLWLVSLNQRQNETPST